MIHKHKLTRDMRSRSVSNDSSGTAFLTPIPGGASKILNSGASYATGGMFRSLSNVPRIPIVPPVINKWLLGPPSLAIDEVTAPTSRGSSSEMDLLMAENSSLLLRLQAVEKENNFYRNQAPEKVPQFIPSVVSVQKPVTSEVSSQTDQGTSAKCPEDKKALDMLNMQVDGLQQKWKESQKKNELLEQKLNASLVQQKESVELREEEKKKHAADLIKHDENLLTLKQEVLELRSLNHPVKAIPQHMPLPPPHNQQNNIEKVKLLLEKFRVDHKKDKNMIASVVTKFGESLRASEEEMQKIIKTEIQNRELKFKKALITKEDEIENLSLKMKEMDGLLTCANERGEIITKDVSNLSERLALACTCLQEVTAKHVLVVQSLTHDAHVRDLARIAALRESALDRDRVTNDLQFCRDVVNIVSFSLKTAEQCLEEDRPELHSKLVSGRAKRLKVLQSAAAEKQKDTDQRSIEMCSLSSAHLDDFQLKSKERVVAVAAEFAVLLETLRNHVDISIQI